MNAQATSREFKSLGGTIFLQAEGQGSAAAVAEAEQLVHDLHRRLTRFEPDSELSLLNRDPRRQVPASDLMLRFAAAVGSAGQSSGGLVDATLLDQVERAGYTHSIDPDIGPIDLAEEPAAGSGQTLPSCPGNWRDVTVDRERSMVIRPVGLRLDSGGLGKGLAADIVAEHLIAFEAWAVICAGDLRFGGTRGAQRRIDVTSPHDPSRKIARLHAGSGAVATSGTTRRSWQAGGRAAHHLIDPRTGRPAETGLIQVTAVAETALEAEVRAKAALLSGPDQAVEWLPDGGVIVTDRGDIRMWGFERWS